MAYLLQHLLSQSARRTPDRQAVVFDEQTLTFDALEQLTNQLAWALIKNGAKRGDRIGIYVNKSLASIVSLFAILKAGGIYVPLDPNAPSARLAYIIQDCGIRCLLTAPARQDQLRDIVAEVGPLDLLVWHDTSANAPPIDGLAHQSLTASTAAGNEPASTPPTQAIDTDLAYILYTSGSTGQPKGVMLSHLNALTFINWASERFNIASSDRLSNHAPLHFDLSVLDIFAAIKAGATLIIVPEETPIFPGQLAAFIAAHRISVWYSVPSVLTMLTLYGELARHDLRALRLILFAGEVYPVKYLRMLMQALPHAAYYNLYGPTETNVCTYYHVSRIPSEEITSIPIGQACENTEVFALDAEGHLVAQPGQEGELYVRGSTVMCGYWGWPEKTGAVLLSDPLQSHQNDRVYRTGDLVTRDDRGNYIFLGRRDHMIKSRGYRIELGEIEAALYSHAAIKEAAVVALPDELIGNRIYAYVVPHDGIPLDPEEIRRHCTRWLPHYMIPEVVKFQDSLPKTSTGKIDRLSLARQACQAT